MGTDNTAEERLASGIGATMFVAWLLFLGPVGLLALLVVAYAMVVQNLALGIVSALLLATPVVLAGAWIPVAFYALLRSRWAGSRVPVGETALDTTID
ncbi:MAG: hypothetical protein WBG50_09425 [Desulfomonilaceae bacterium]